jgi:hypothetical protein
MKNGGAIEGFGVKEEASRAKQLPLLNPDASTPNHL